MMNEGSGFGNGVDKDEIIKEFTKLNPFVLDEICHESILSAMFEHLIITEI